MTSFDTGYIWEALADEGRIATSALVATYPFNIGLLSNEEIREGLIEHLRVEAREEGVSLRIERSEKYDDLLYVYLRKGN